MSVPPLSPFVIKVTFVLAAGALNKPTPLCVFLGLGSKVLSSAKTFLLPTTFPGSPSDESSLTIPPSSFCANDVAMAMDGSLTNEKSMKNESIIASNLLLVFICPPFMLN